MYAIYEARHDDEDTYDLIGWAKDESTARVFGLSYATVQQRKVRCVDVSATDYREQMGDVLVFDPCLPLLRDYFSRKAVTPGDHEEGRTNA